MKKSTFFADQYGHMDIMAEAFKKKIPEFYNQRYIYSRCVSDINKELIRAMVEEDAVIKLPNRMGLIYVNAKKVNLDKLMINVVASGLAKKTVYYLNDHTDGYFYAIEWFKKGITLNRNASLYSYYKTRKIKRSIYDNVKLGRRYTKKD